MIRAGTFPRIFHRNKFLLASPTDGTPLLTLATIKTLLTSKTMTLLLLKITPSNPNTPTPWEAAGLLPTTNLRFAMRSKT